MQAAGPYETLNLSAPPSRKRCRAEAAHAAPHGIGRPIELSARCLVLAIARCQSVVYAAVVTPRVCRESASWQKPGIALTCALRRSPHHPRSPLRLSLDARIHECSRGNRSRRGPEGPIKPDCWSACLDYVSPSAAQRARRPQPHSGVAGSRPTHLAGQWQLAARCTAAGHSPSAHPGRRARVRQVGAVTTPVCSSRLVLQACRRGSAVRVHGGGSAAPSMGRGGYAAAAQPAHRGGPTRDSPVRGVVRWYADVVVVVRAVHTVPPPPSRWRRPPTRPHCQRSSGDPQRISSMAAAHAARRMTPTAIAAVATCNPRPHRHHGGGDQCGAPLPIQQWGPLRLDVIMSRTLLVVRSPSP